MPSPSSSSLSQSINALHNGHIMLLYEDNYKLNIIIIEYINEWLKNGYLCIYASVDIGNFKGISLIDTLPSRIINYEENIRNGNIQFINLKPSYESVLKGDYTLVEELKSELEYILFKRISEGKKDKVLVFADAVCTLSENKHFNECIDLEKWWQDVHTNWVRNNKNIFVVCPHHNYIFKDSEQGIRNKISALHTITIDIKDEHSLQDLYDLISDGRQIKILIAEGDSDLRDLYNEYLNSLGLEVTIVENGNKCIENIY